MNTICPACHRVTTDPTDDDARAMYCERHLKEAQALIEQLYGVKARAKEIVTSLLGVLLVAWGCW